MTENPINDAGIEDDPTIPEPDEFEAGDEEQEFDVLDGIDVPDPDNAAEEEV